MTDRTPTGDLPARLTAALDTDPHYTTREVVATVMRVLTEPGGDLRDQIAEALGQSIVQWWQTPPRLDLAADAALHPIEAETAALRQRAKRADDRAEAAGYEATSARLDLREAERKLNEALDLLREFVHDTPCDPHPGTGFCQTHAHRPPCPHAAAKKLLAAEQPSRAECGDYDPAVAMTNPMTAPPAEYLAAEQPKETP